MKKLLLVAALCCFSSNAFSAENDTYFSVKYSYAKEQIKFKETFKNKDNVSGLRFAVGKYVAPSIRAELEIGIDDEMKDSKSSNHPETLTDYAYAEKETIKTDKSHLFLNGYYDFKTDSTVTPYVGVGVGVAKVKVSSEYNYNGSYPYFLEVGSGHGSKTSYNLAYQVSVGVNIKCDEKLSFDIGYRYADYGKAKYSNNWGFAYADGYGYDTYSGTDSESKKLTSNEFTVGMRYSF